MLSWLGPLPRPFAWLTVVAHYVVLLEIGWAQLTFDASCCVLPIFFGYVSAVLVSYAVHCL